MRRRLIISLGARVFGALLQLVFVSLLARGLGIDDFGVLSVVTSLLQATFSLTELGFSSQLLRASKRADRGSLHFSLVIVRVFAALLSIGLVVAVATLHTSWNLLLIIAVAIYVYGEFVGDQGIVVLQGEFRSYASAAVLILRRCAALIPLAISVSVAGAVIGLILAGLLGVVIFLSASVRRIHGRPHLIQTLRGNIPYALLGGAFGLQSFDSAIVGFAGGPSLAGLYGASTRLSNPLNLLISTATQVLTPTLAAAQSGERFESFRRVRRVSFVVAAALAVLSLSSPLVVSLLYGERYARAVPIVAAVFIGAGLSAISQSHTAFLVASHVRKVFAVRLTAVIVGSLALIGTAASLAGTSGVALGYLLLQFAILAVVLREYSRVKRT